MRRHKPHIYTPCLTTPHCLHARSPLFHFLFPLVYSILISSICLLRHPIVSVCEVQVSNFLCEHNHFLFLSRPTRCRSSLDRPEERAKLFSTCIATRNIRPLQCLDERINIRIRTRCRHIVLCMCASERTYMRMCVRKKIGGGVGTFTVIGGVLRRRSVTSAERYVHFTLRPFGITYCGGNSV